MRKSSSYAEFDPELGDLQKKRSLIRRDRQRMDENNPRFHYTQVANQQLDHLRIQPSLTGLDPTVSQERSGRPSFQLMPHVDEEEGIPLMEMEASPRGGREIIGLNDEVLPKKKGTGGNKSTKNVPKPGGANAAAARGSDMSFWKFYCYLITFWAPGPLLGLFGLKTKDRQYAWREKMGLISCILYIGAFVAYITFGFTRTVCHNTTIKTRNNEVSTGYLIINGRAYDLTLSQHPKAAGIPGGSNILYPPINAGGMDGSFLFQNVNGNCKGLIKPRDNCSIPYNGDELAWYMPCRLFAQDGSTEPNRTHVYYDGWACHTSSEARDVYYNMEVNGDVYFTWDDIRNSTRNLVVFSGDVLDLDLIEWILKDDVTYPQLFDTLRTDPLFKGHDILMVLASGEDRQAAKCLSEIIKVGVIDSETVGCICSKIVLYVSLVFILSVVIVKFLMACYFRWWIALRQGATELDNKSTYEREKEIENWVDNPSAAAPLTTVPVKARADYRQQKTNRQSVFIKSSHAQKLIPASDINKYYEDGENKLSKTFKYTTMSTQAALLGKSKKVGRDQNSRSMVFSHSRASSIDLLSRPASMLDPFQGQT